MMQELLLSYDGREYRCRPTYDVLMHIEDRVTLHGLATRIAQGAESGHVPVTHICWLFYCLLNAAGAPVSAQSVMDDFKQGKIEQTEVEKVIGFILGEVFGVGPEETMSDTDAESSEGSEDAKKQQQAAS